MPAPPVPERFFIDVNFLGSAYSNAIERRFVTYAIQSGELATFRVTYPQPTDARVFPILDIGGGMMLGQRAGIGVAFSQATYDDPAELLVTIPHPFFLQAPGTGTASSDPLRRTENSTHIFLTVMLMRKSRMEWRISGGPSIISYSAEMVSSIQYEQDAPPSSQTNTVTITGYTTSEVHGLTLGVHGGSDFAYDLTRSRRIALTGGVRGSLGTVTIDHEPLNNLKQEIRVGGWRVFAGLRFRFGTVSSK